tara:strand:- start:2933 stop:3223 length:291 start_codon:yes stop_codon:yes gene_type:complete
MSNPSICIPRTTTAIRKNDVLSCIEKITGSGSVKRIDIVRKTNKVSDYQCIFIHIDEWPNTPLASRVRNILLTGKNVNIVYKAPHFWKCYANNNTT